MKVQRNFRDKVSHLEVLPALVCLHGKKLSFNPIDRNQCFPLVLPSVASKELSFGKHLIKFFWKRRYVKNLSKKIYNKLSLLHKLSRRIIFLWIKKGTMKNITKDFYKRIITWLGRVWSSKGYEMKKWRTKWVHCEWNDFIAKNLTNLIYLLI